MIVQEILSRQSNPRDDLDALLADLCEMVINCQEKDSEYYGLVAACVICPGGKKYYGVNHAAEDGRRVHAERAAIEACGEISSDCMIVTTLSPCNSPMDERYGESCTDLLESHGISHVYCGYRDPSQDADMSVETENPKLRELCKRFADTFLDDLTEDRQPRIEFVDGTLVVSKHFLNDRSKQRGITLEMIYRALHRLEQQYSDRLRKLGFVNFVVKANDFGIAVSKQKDKYDNIVYVVLTAHPTLKIGRDQDVVYLEDTLP